MATQTLKLNVKSGEKDGKNFWDRCGVIFVNTDDSGNITSIHVKHSMFPNMKWSPFRCTVSLSLCQCQSLNMALAGSPSFP